MRLILAACLFLLAPTMACAMSPITFEIDKTARFRINRVDYERTSHWDICVFRPAPRENYKPGSLWVRLYRGGREPLDVALATGEAPEGCTAFSFSVPAAAVHDIQLMVMDTGSGYSGNWQFYSGPVDELPEWKPVAEEAPPKPMKFTDYASALGSPVPEDIGGATFPGQIEITGMLGVDRDKDRPECRQGCAWFEPDEEMLARLPRVLVEDVPEPYRIYRIDLGPARAALQGSYSAQELDRLLGPSLKTLFGPAKLRLRQLHVRMDCDTTSYDAKVVKLDLNPAAIVNIKIEPIFFPTC